MKNINKIVDLIIKELFKVDDMDDSKQRVIMQLLESGIPPDQINKAFHFIIKKINQNNKNKNVGDRKFRILTNRERSRLSEDAHQSLYDYYYNNTLSWTEMEELINRIERMEYVVDVKGINYIVEQLVFGNNFKGGRISSSIIN